MARSQSSAGPCPCGRPLALDSCCGPYVSGERVAPDPESLMRSRYTAFSLATPEALEYLFATHHPDFRDPTLRDGLRASVASVDTWEKLEVHAATSEGDRGTVDFVATYRVGGQRMQLREHSEFEREGGRWLYTRGTIG